MDYFYFEKIYSALNKFLVLLCLIAFSGAIVYRIYCLNSAGVVITVLITALAYWRYWQWQKKQSPENKSGQALEKKRMSRIGKILAMIYAILFLICVFILISSRTGQSIISPWQVVPGYFFLFYFLASIFLGIIVAREKSYGHLFVIPHCLLSFSIAWLVYKTGYGFDPFIHTATMSLIDKTGAVYPKPYYYLGQYSLIVIIHKITFLPISWLNSGLVPLLASVYLPLEAIRAQKKDDSLSAGLWPLFLLILIYSFAIVTTPQNFAYILLLIIIFRGFGKNNNRIELMIFAGAALVIQPIAGLPAMIYAGLLVWQDKAGTTKKVERLIYILSASILPLLFFILNKTQSQAVPSPRTVDWRAVFNLPKFSLAGQENIILNFVYLYGFNLKIIFFLLAAGGLIIVRRSNKENARQIYTALALSVCFFISYLAVKFLPFNFLIDYERGDYDQRILLVSAFFALPCVLALLAWLEVKARAQSGSVKYPLAVLVACLATSSLYLSYPRTDNYFNSHGYSVGRNDLTAVRWINENAGSEPYIVLANQQTSAAALHEFGFKKYYKNDIFYYPIPTGGPLYQYYLEMVNKKPDRKTLKAAADLAGVKLGYFVISKYWWASTKIVDEAKLSADSWQNFGDGEVLVFKYTF